VSERGPARTGFDPLARRSWADLGPRLASAAVLLAVAAAALYLGGYVFAATVGAVFAGCYREWERMVTLRPLTPTGMVLIGCVAVSGLLYPALGAWSLAPVAGGALIAAAAPLDTRWWRALGVLFYGGITYVTLAMRGEGIAQFDAGLLAGVFVGLVTWVTDSGAYFAGRQVGGEKLAPDISPGKTWSGAVGGLLAGTLAGLVFWLAIIPQSPWWIGLALSAGMSLVGQAGDLTESAVKRRFRIKDSGDMIPGHGGLMDRLDSFSFAVLFLFIVGALHRGLDSAAAGFLYW
jgi:phosphatidate cytidylyltransferase